MTERGQTEHTGDGKGSKQQHLGQCSTCSDNLQINNGTLSPSRLSFFCAAVKWRRFQKYCSIKFHAPLTAQSQPRERLCNNPGVTTGCISLSYSRHRRLHSLSPESFPVSLHIHPPSHPAYSVAIILSINLSLSKSSFLVIPQPRVYFSQPGGLLSPCLFTSFCLSALRLFVLSNTKL